MKPLHAFLLGLAVVAVTVVILPRNPAPEELAAATEADTPEEPAVVLGTGEGASALDIILRRKSVRTYTDEPVSKDALETVLRAGMAAPTGGNREPWVFMVVTDREKLDALAELTRAGSMLAQAQAAIMVGGVPEWGIPGEVNAYWVQDCSAVTQNILLAIEALELGAVWIGVHPRAEREQQIRDILGVPEDVVPFSLIAIGHPGGDEQPKNKWKPRRIHWEEWSAEQFEQR